MGREGYIPVGNGRLYCREVGGGRPIVVLHGGPEFNCNYLLPEMDRLSDAFRLIYYDQRGRGRSAGGVNPEDVTIQSDAADLESVRRYFQMETVALLGHSWGATLALEYAIRHSDRVSHLILLNTAPVSREDYLLLRQERRRNSPADIETLKAMAATDGFRDGDPAAMAEYYRVHFRATLRQPEHLDRLIRNLGSGFTTEGILKARAVEKRLVRETWLSSEYNLLPDLARLNIRTLVVHGDYDFIPLECATHVAQAIPGARFRLLPDCGHFAYIEQPEAVRREIIDLLREAPARGH